MSAKKDKPEYSDPAHKISSSMIKSAFSVSFKPSYSKRVQLNPITVTPANIDNIPLGEVLETKGNFVCTHCTGWTLPMVFSDIDFTGLDSIELILQQPIRTLYLKYFVFGLTTNHGNLASLTLVEPQF